VIEFALRRGGSPARSKQIKTFPVGITKKIKQNYGYIKVTVCQNILK